MKTASPVHILSGTSSHQNLPRPFFTSIATMQAQSQKKRKNDGKQHKPTPYLPPDSEPSLQTASLPKQRRITRLRGLTRLSLEENFYSPQPPAVEEFSAAHVNELLQPYDPARFPNRRQCRNALFFSPELPESVNCIAVSLFGLGFCLCELLKLAELPFGRSVDDTPRPCILCYMAQVYNKIQYHSLLQRAEYGDMYIHLPFCVNPKDFHPEDLLFQENIRGFPNGIQRCFLRFSTHIRCQLDAARVRYQS